MQITKDFYKAEERCGFTVTEEMKSLWAVELDLFEKLKSVCEKYNITYHASGGTLLGAIRHKGYIPWDDDIDITMLRADYDKLLAVADKEFSEPYFFQTAYNDIGYSNGHAQLRNSNTTAILKSSGGKYKYNQGIFIDIFPVDNIPDDEALFAAQKRKIGFLNKLLAMTVRYPGSPNKNIVKTILHCITTPLIPYRKVYKKLEQVCSQYNNQETKRVGLLSFVYNEERFYFPKHVFDKTLNVPFEMTEIAIPEGYDEILKIQYNNYMEMRKENSYHGGLIIDALRPYTEYLNK